MSTTSVPTTAPITTPSASTTAPSTTTTASTTTPSTTTTAPTTTTTTHPSAATTTSTSAATPPSILRTSLPAAQARLAALSAEIKYAKADFATCCDAMRGAVVEELERQLERVVEEIGEAMMERVFRVGVVEDMRRVFEETRVGWAMRAMRGE